jgi:hypothetical protein
MDYWHLSYSGNAKMLRSYPSDLSTQCNSIAKHNISRLVRPSSQRHTKTRKKAPARIARPKSRTKKMSPVFPSLCSGMTSLSLTTVESQDSSSHQMRPSSTKETICEPHLWFRDHALSSVFAVAHNTSSDTLPSINTD